MKQLQNKDQAQRIKTGFALLFGFQAYIIIHAFIFSGSYNPLVLILFNAVWLTIFLSQLNKLREQKQKQVLRVTL